MNTWNSITHTHHWGLYVLAPLGTHRICIKIKAFWLTGDSGNLLHYLSSCEGITGNNSRGTKIRLPATKKQTLRTFDFDLFILVKLHGWQFLQNKSTSCPRYGIFVCHPDNSKSQEISTILIAYVECQCFKCNVYQKLYVLANKRVKENIWKLFEWKYIFIDWKAFYRQLHQEAILGKIWSHKEKEKQNMAIRSQDVHPSRVYYNKHTADKSHYFCLLKKMIS